MTSGGWRVAGEEERKAWETQGLVAPDYRDPVAADYPDCLRIVEEKVKPERMKNNRKVYREKWWQYAEKRPELYRTIAGMERVMVKSEVGNKLSFDLVPTNWVFSHMLIVFAMDHYWEFTLIAFLHLPIGP